MFLLRYQLIAEILKTAEPIKINQKETIITKDYEKILGYLPDMK